MTPVASSTPLTAAQILEQEFLTLRAKVLETAAGFDRLERAAGDVSSDPRYANLLKAIDALKVAGPDRAERLQKIFSLPYDPEWKRKFEYVGGSSGKNS